MADVRRARIERLLGAAAQLADPADADGRALRAQLLETTGLSAAGIELGLTRCLETHATDAALDALVSGTPASPRAHVLLSGNVFVAALRAVAIALASSARVSVRASRRDPALARALHRLLPDAFELVEALAPEAGDHVWAYGSDDTLVQVKSSLTAGVWFHAHGHGVGAVVLETNGLQLDAAARAIAIDTALFDQRGCLSPRLVCVAGSPEETRQIAQALALALGEQEGALPPGPRGAAELAEARAARDAARYAFELFEAGSGWVTLGQEAQPVLPATPRCLHVIRAAEPSLTLAPLSSHLTCIGSSVSASTASDLRRSFPGARHVALGEMQRPPLDGPVDLRHDRSGVLTGSS